MNENFEYHFNEFERQAQRFTIPLYIKDELGNYKFSSSGTLVRYNQNNYLIFAAHALNGGIDFTNVFTFFNTGEFHNISQSSNGYFKFEEDDIVIVDYLNVYFEQKNYFNLGLSSMLGFDKKHFSWTGFPVSWAKSKNVHNSLTPEKLKEKFVYTDTTRNYFTNAKIFTILSEIKSNNSAFISGEYIRDNVDLKYSGALSKGPSPKGMSGGPMYFFSKDRELRSTIDDSFRFAGIGIEHRKNNEIIGVAKQKIIQLINSYESRLQERIIHSLIAE